MDRGPPATDESGFAAPTGRDRAGYDQGMAFVIFVNVPCRAVDMRPIPAMQATATRATMRAYSTIVAPSSPRANFLAAAVNLAMESAPSRLLGQRGLDLGEGALEAGRHEVDPGDAGDGD